MRLSRGPEMNCLVLLLTFLAAAQCMLLKPVSRIGMVTGQRVWFSNAFTKGLERVLDATEKGDLKKLDRLLRTYHPDHFDIALTQSMITAARNDRLEVIEHLILQHTANPHAYNDIVLKQAQSYWSERVISYLSAISEPTAGETPSVVGESLGALPRDSSVTPKKARRKNPRTVKE